MENKTTEFSFVVKSAKYGVGVFTTHDIKKETCLRLFGEEKKTTDISIIRKKKDLPDFFIQYCIDRGETMVCPKDFGHLEIGWFMNHSKNPNAFHKNYHFYALRDIKEGEEITVDYNTFEEPQDLKEYYY